MRSSRSEWQERLERWQRSGQSLREFAAKEGVRFLRLRWWRWELERTGELLDTPSVQPMANSSLPVRAPVTFVELAAHPESHAAPIEIALSNGRVVRVPPAFDDGALTRILAVADGAA